MLTILLICAPVLFSCESAEQASGKLTIGSTEAPTGDWEGYFGANAADKDIIGLISGYSTVAMNKKNELLYDPTVVSNIKEELDSDGNKTFTFTLAKDLRYNDGSAITAKDYVFRILFFSSPVITQAGCDGTAGVNYTGWAGFCSGANKEFSGVRLLDTYKFSVIVSTDYIPYYWDKAMVQISPMPMRVWLPEGIDIADDGGGAYFTGDFTYENCKDTINEGRNDSENRISCGPYTLTAYDQTANTAVLSINKNYKGNYEEQKPRIKELVYIKINEESKIDILAAGAVDMLRQLSGDDVRAALKLTENGAFAAAGYNRSGYGKLSFACDMGPTRFAEVRRAIAYLIDRETLAQTVCSGYAGVVNGPYGLSMSMYSDAKEKLNKKLNSYKYNPAKAVEILEAGGWIYAFDGSPYTSGIRYKVVSAEEAAGNPHNITLEDGRILMPLIIEWCSSSDNSVTEYLRTVFVQNPDVPAAGMQINETNVPWQELLNWLYRNKEAGEQYGTPKYGIFNLAANISVLYDQSYYYTLDEAYISRGYNPTRIANAQLDKLSMDMVYNVIPGDRDKFIEIWTDFIVLWNELLPELPLYSNIYYDVYSGKLKNYDADPARNIADSIIYCYIED